MSNKGLINLFSFGNLICRISDHAGWHTWEFLLSNFQRVECLWMNKCEIDKRTVSTLENFVWSEMGKQTAQDKRSVSQTGINVCYRHHFSKFTDFSLAGKKAFPWPKKYKMSDLVAASCVNLLILLRSRPTQNVFPAFNGIKSFCFREKFLDFALFQLNVFRPLKGSRL